MSKKIESYAELVRVCRSAGLWYIGSFMTEFLEKQELWRDPERKGEFIHYMLSEYDVGDSESSAITRINCVIRIVESKKVADALQMVLDCNDKKLGCPESKINAQLCLEEIAKGNLKF